MDNYLINQINNTRRIHLPTTLVDWGSVGYTSYDHHPHAKRDAHGEVDLLVAHYWVWCKTEITHLNHIYIYSIYNIM